MATPNRQPAIGNRQLKRLASALLKWFSENARDLPWRRTCDPYAIWVSEIMLQQTQVKTVIPYWKRWLRELPTIKSVANASPDKIHKLWEGLGYYTRARNLRKAAQQIVTRQDAISKSSRSRGLSRRSETQTDNETQIKKKLEIPSAFARLRRDKHVVSYKFPENFDNVLALPGIGRYTAGAICSIAFDQPVPILDGNVIRVLTRMFGISQNPREKKTNARLWKLAEELVGRAVPSPPRRGGDTAPYHSFLNQSLMELGALVCAPRNPRCLICPVKKLCAAFRENRVNELPNFGKRTPVAARHFVAFIAERKGRFLVRRRPAGVVNTHLWEFPNVEIAPSQGGSGRKSAHYFRTKSQSRLTSAATNGLVVRAAKNLGFELSNAEPLCTVKHSITRYRITLEAFRANLGGASYASSHSEKAKSETRVTRPSETIGVWKTAAQMNRLAFAAAHRKILHALVTTKHPHRVVRSSAFRRPA